MSFSQSSRFYAWRYEGDPPIPRRDIEIHSANMHMIRPRGRWSVG